MPANQIAEYKAVYLDAEGETATASAYEFVDDTITVLALKVKRDAWCTAYMGTTGATLQECTVALRKFDSFALPTGVTFATAEDKLYLEFRSLVDGTVYSTSVPAPLASDFESDTETVNFADANVAALITYVQTNGSTKAGKTQLKFVLGYRRRSKSQREKPGRYTAIG
jgi:hypothetical protein